MRQRHADLNGLFKESINAELVNGGGAGRTAVGLADCVYRPLSRLSRLRDQAESPARQAHCPATLLDDQPCGPWQQDYAALHAEIIAGKSCKCVAISQARICSCSKFCQQCCHQHLPNEHGNTLYAHVKQRLHRPCSDTQVRTGKFL